MDNSAIAVTERVTTTPIHTASSSVAPTTFLEAIGDYVFVSKYARYNEKLKRRETWDEAVERVLQMHLAKYSGRLTDEAQREVEWAFEMVKSKKVVPSMRSMQFGGNAVFAHESRIFNCAVRHVDSTRSFAEILYLLLCGCGVGIGLSKKYLGRLPNLVTSEDKTGTLVPYVVEDSIEGWADSVQALMDCYFKNTPYSGRKIVFDYSRIRRKGAKLKTGGGKAPGFKPLKNAHTKIKALLDTVIEDKGQTRLKSIDAYDVLMHCADAVLSGGIRRSATAVVFEKGDEDMMNAKTGNWFETNPQRGRSNNSVLLLRSELTQKEIDEAINRTKEWGEPGFVFADDPDTLFNPCFEIGFKPVTDDGTCGVQYCNLSSVNGSTVESREDFLERVKAATIIGTLQAGYTNFPYLSPAAQFLTEEEALLGVSITGFMDRPDILLNKNNQILGAKLAVEVNEEWAKILGIKQAARVCCVKPEGTSSLVLGSSSGINPHPAQKYIRRVQANKMDAVYDYFKAFNSGMTEESIYSANKTDDVISFPLTVNEHALTAKDLDAVKHLQIIRDTQKYWVLNGMSGTNKKPVAHNVSCTVNVKEDEWSAVSKFMFKNAQYFSAVSFLPDDGGKRYAQAPWEPVETPEDTTRFEALEAAYQPMDYTFLREDHDETHLQEALACAGGKCEIV